MTGDLRPTGSLVVAGLARRDRAHPLAGVSFEAAPRRTTVLLGPPGSGKSALLRAVAGLDPVDQGTVEVGGRQVTLLPPHRRGIGLVLQGLALFSHLDAAENIRFGLRTARWHAAERELRVAELLRLVGLGERGHAPIERLSGPERLRVAVARALALEPSVLLLDEPLAGIDAARRLEERSALREILRRLQMTVVVATDDADDAAALGTELVVISGGRVVQAGSTAAVLGQPASAEVARVAGYATLIDGRVEGGRVNELGVGAIDLPAPAEAGARVEVMAHPATLLAVPAGHGLGIGVSGIVMMSHPRGPAFLLEVSLGDRRRVLARWEWDPEPPAPGARVELTSQPGSLRFYRRIPVVGEDQRTAGPQPGAPAEAPSEPASRARAG